MASRVSLIQSRSIYVGTANNVAPSDGNLIVTGNVGIGTTSPAYKLDVDSGGAIEAARFYNSSYSATVVYIGDTGNSDYSDLILQSNSGAGEIFKAGTGYASWGGTLALNIYNSNGAIAFHPNGIANAMFINTSGNVGIGTTSPAQKLQVIGNAWINRPSNKVDNNGATEFGSRVEFNNSFASNESGYMVFQYPSYNNFLIGGDYDGHIGGGIPNIQFGRSNGTVYMHIASSNGNVGIGTTSPASKLQIGSVGSTGYSVGNGLAFGDGTRAGALNVESSGTNLYSSTNLIFSPGTTEAVRITSAGNVGIGTTSPSEKLHVAGGNIMLSNTVAAGAPVGGIIFKQTNSSGFDIAQIQGIAGATVVEGILTLSTKDSGGTMNERMRITAAGNVGIGTTGPSSILHVDGIDPYVRINNVGSANTQGIKISYNYSDTHGFHLLYNGNNAASYVDNTYPITSGQPWGDIYFRQNSAGTMVTRMTIKADGGNVGIGTTNPAYKLDISGVTRFQDVIRFKATAWQLSDSDSANRLYFSAYGRTYFGSQGGYEWRSAADTALAVITDAGNVGIGTTSPAYKLDVVGEGKVTGKFRVGGAVMLAEPGTGVLLFGSEGGNQTAIYSASLERIRINDSGNVGIGTTSPSYKLHTVGDAYFTSFTGVGATPSSSWSFVVDALAGTDGAIKTTGSVLINTGALGVNITPSATAGRIDASNDIVAYSTSDQRLKENITPIANALDKVKALNGVEFDWKEETKAVHGYEGHDVGVIAQEVQAVLPEAVRTNDSGYLSVRYEKMIALLVEANKELAARVELLESKLKQ